VFGWRECGGDGGGAVGERLRRDFKDSRGFCARELQVSEKRFDLIVPSFESQAVIRACKGQGVRQDFNRRICVQQARVAGLNSLHGVNVEFCDLTPKYLPQVAVPSLINGYDHYWRCGRKKLDLVAGVRLFTFLRYRLQKYGSAFLSCQWVQRNSRISTSLR